MAGQMIALLTGVPDFFVQFEKFSDGKKYFRSGVDHFWDSWVTAKMKSYQKELGYEEGIVIKLVDRELYFNPLDSQFRVEFDIDKGEFDRSNSMIGKIKGKFNLEISNKFLAWARSIWIKPHKRKEQDGKKVLRMLNKIIAQQVLNARRRWQLAPWSKDIERLIANELLTQIALYKGGDFSHPQGIRSIGVHFNYGLFALKHLHLKWESANHNL